MLVLDTNNISYCFRGDPAVLLQLQALHHQGTLVTRNPREFARVPGLMWVNWHEGA